MSKSVSDQSVYAARPPLLGKAPAVRLGRLRIGHVIERIKKFFLEIVAKLPFCSKYWTPSYKEWLCSGSYSARDHNCAMAALNDDMGKVGNLAEKESILQDAAKVLMEAPRTPPVFKEMCKSLNKAPNTRREVDAYFLSKKLLSIYWTSNPEKVEETLSFGLSMPTAAREGNTDPIQDFPNLLRRYVASTEDSSFVKIFYFFYSHIFPPGNINYLIDTASQEDDLRIKEIVLCTAGCLAARYGMVDNIALLIENNKDHRAAILGSVLMGSEDRDIFLANFNVSLGYLQERLNEAEYDTLFSEIGADKYIQSFLGGVSNSHE